MEREINNSMYSEPYDEVDFSIVKVIIYFLRKWLIILLAVVIGLIGAMTFFLVKTQYDVVVYEGKLIYGKAYNGVAGTSEDGSYYSYLTKVTNTFVIMMSNDVTSVVSDKYAYKLYPEIAKEADRVKSFYKNLHLVREGDTLKVLFAYRLEESANEGLAREVVENILLQAQLKAKEFDPELSILGNEFIKIAPYKNLNAKPYDQFLETKQPSSVLEDLLIGMLIGIVGGFLIVAVLYFVDPKIRAYESIRRNAGELLKIVREEDKDYGEIAVELDIKRVNSGMQVVAICGVNEKSDSNMAVGFVASKLVELGRKVLVINLNERQEVDRTNCEVVNYRVKDLADINKYLSEQKNLYEMILINSSYEQTKKNIFVVASSTDAIYYLINLNCSHTKDVNKYIECVNKMKPSDGSILYAPNSSFVE